MHVPPSAHRKCRILASPALHYHLEPHPHSANVTAVSSNSARVYNDEYVADLVGLYKKRCRISSSA